MPTDDDSHPVELKDAVTFALDEARMVLPGIQALFGFQLIAVFNNRFEDVFDSFGQQLHLLALLLVALSCGLVMAPAAYHRRTGHLHVSKRLLSIISGFVGAAMVPLMLAISIDVGLVAFAVTESPAASAGLAVSCGLVLAALWLVFPKADQTT
jgi:hypothetical protein